MNKDNGSSGVWALCRNAGLAFTLQLRDQAQTALTNGEIDSDEERQGLEQIVEVCNGWLDGASVEASS